MGRSANSISESKKIRTLRMLLGYFKRKELRPKLKHILDFLLNRAIAKEIAIFASKGIILTEKQLNHLEKLAKATHAKKHLIERARIILLCAENLNNTQEKN